MLRRAAVYTRALAAPTLCGLRATSATSPCTRVVRHAHHKPTTHDWSGMWSRELTPEEAVAVRQQAHRTVSAVVPGEMFMRHWIMADQSTLSVTNRVVGGIVAVFTMIWAAGYATLGYNGHNCAHTAGWIFIAYWLVFLEFHQLWMLPAVLAVGALQLAFN